MARIAAPLALVLAVVVVFAVINASTGDDGGETRSGGQGRAERSGGTAGRSKQEKPSRSSYVVEEGDSLSAIADRFGLTVDEILALNEGVDPQALATGQKLKLR